MKRVLAALAGAVLALSAAQPAWADWRYRNDDRGWDHGWHRGHREFYPREELFVIYPPRPRPQVFYAEPPRPMQATPMSPTFMDSYGRYCREYQSEAFIGGMLQPTYGAACLMPDGVWRVVR